MIRLTLRPFLTGALLLSAAFSFLTLPRVSAQTAGYATQVLDYTVGTGIGSSFSNASSALGQPGGNVGSGTLNPFSPHYAGSELTGVGLGGQLTLGLSNFVTVGPAGTREIGFFGNVGLLNTGGNNAPQAGNPASVFGLRSVLIAVSADGVNFVPLNGGALVTSTLPANYYANVNPADINAPPPANPVPADFGKPFLGSLTDFNGGTYAQILTTLGGSAGGTWLDLSSTGLSQVGFIRFSEPANSGVNGGVFYLNGVSSNTASLGGAVPAVPEPGTWAMLAAAAAGVLAWRRSKRWTLAAAGLAAVAAAPLSGRAQLIGSLTEGPASAAYSYYLTIQFDSGRYYNFTLRSNAASYTGTDFINTVAAGSQTTPFVLTVDQQLFNQTSHYVNGLTINGDANSGFQNNGYWSYWLGDATTPVQWHYADVGEDDRTITPGQADGWVFGNDANGTNPPQATGFAVPEPSSLLLTILPLAAVGFLRRRRVSQD